MKREGEALSREARREAGKTVNSAGAIVFRQGPQGREVLMIRARAGGWSFPKGHLEAGESPEETACREVAEETGMEIRLLPGFCSQVPSALPGERRTVSYFLGLVTGGRLRPQPEEVADAAWQPVDAVPGLLRFAQDLPPFRAALDFVSGAE